MQEHLYYPRQIQCTENTIHYKNITENVNLPIPLLTRFDFIYVIRDIPEKDKDSKIASHILEIHKDVQENFSNCN